MSLVNEIDKILPQTQCRACGFNGCRPYAQALASGLATIDKCPPGGVETLKALAKLMKLDSAPYLAHFDDTYRPPSVAKIDESQCIGCTKCIQACPVDAIVGASKLMHYIVAEDCTGCGLCVEPCPVDCITMQELPAVNYDKDRAKARYEARLGRLDKQAREQQAKRSLDMLSKSSSLSKQAFIQEALQRVKQKKS